MIEPFEYRGEWWLPENKEDKKYGALKFTPHEGATLDIVGFWGVTSYIEVIEREMIKPKIIHGLTSNGKEITLYNCMQTNRRAELRSGSIEATFYAQFVMIGVWFMDEEDIKFKLVRYRCSRLGEWFRISGFEETLRKDEIKLIYKLREKMNLTTCNGFQISSYLRLNTKHSTVGSQQYTFMETVYLELYSKEPRPFQDYIDLISSINRLITLAVMEPVIALEFEGKVVIDSNTQPEQEPREVDVKVFYPSVEVPGPKKALHPYWMLFTFAAIRGKFDKYFGNWVAKEKLLEPVYELYFPTLYYPEMSPRQKFLSYAQALESYHAQTRDRPVWPKKEHKELSEKLCQVAPSKFKKWLKDILYWGNKMNLKRRLEDLIEKEGVREIFIKFINDTATFVKKVKDSRNYYTHYDKGLKNKAAKGTELYLLTWQMRILIELYLLSEIGFTWEEIKELIKDNQNYAHCFLLKHELDSENQS